MTSLRYTLNYLHSSQQIFSLRSNISEENVTFKWLACTSQESVKFERARRKETAQKKDRARGKEIQSRAKEGKNAREKKEVVSIRNLQTTLIKVPAGKFDVTLTLEVLMSTCVGYLSYAPVWPGARIRVLLRILQKHRGHYKLKLALLVARRVLKF